MTTVVSGEEIVKRMVEVAQRVGGEPSRRDEARFEQLEERLALHGMGHAPKPRLWLGSLAAAACLCVALGAWWLHTPALTYAVLGGAVESGVVVGREHTKIHFSDGSEVALEPGAQASIEDMTARGGRVKLRQGRVTVDIVKKPDTRWFVDAGPYAVRVTGTAFDVRWSSAERKFELDLHHGSVVITGPQIDKGYTLGAGQKLIGRSEGPVVVEGPTRALSSALRSASPGRSPSSVQGAIASADATSTSAEALPPLEAPQNARVPEASAHTPWSQKVAQGKFQAVIDEAQRRGLEQTLATASIEDLSALADAARYASSTGIARRALLAERQRFARSNAAREAAFFLGRLAEERGEGALEWYDRYLSESPKGPYASQALGRRMMIFYRQRGQETTLPLAREYLQRFPKGPYATAARKILGQSLTQNP
ncbi:MAG TPA: FecR domain-containing protein [Polyangiaceae bacterium]|nr:FecR domain-containing protein [Polyangiaceae bacterium]